MNISPNSDSPSDAIEVALSGLSEATASSEEREETPVVEVMPVVTNDIIDDVSTVAVVDEVRFSIDYIIDVLPTAFGCSPSPSPTS